MEQAVRVTAQMLEMREDARRIFGANYTKRLEPFREAIVRWKKQSGKPLAVVVLYCVEQTEKHGNEFDLLAAVAAGVEEMEQG